MEWGTVFGGMAAFAGLLTASVTAAATFKVLLPVKRDAKAIHTIVNQDRTDRLRFQAVLIQALEDNGIAVPEDQSKVDTE